MPPLALVVVGILMVIAFPSTICLTEKKPNFYEFHSNTLQCSVDMIRSTLIVSTGPVQSLIDCARHCGVEHYCDLAVYWKSSDGKEFCTKLARISLFMVPTGSPIPDLFSLEKMLVKREYLVCRILEVNRCQKGSKHGTKDNVCHCKEGFLGELCEYEVSYCNPTTYHAYYVQDKFSTVQSIPTPSVIALNSEHTVRFYSEALRAFVYTTGAQSFLEDEKLFVSTSESVELSSWDSFAKPIRREFGIFGKDSSEIVLVTIDNQKQKCTKSSVGVSYAIDSLESTKFRIFVSQRDGNKNIVLDHLNRGHEILNSNYEKHELEGMDSKIVYQLTASQVKLLSGESKFEEPVAFVNSLTEFSSVKSTSYATVCIGLQSDGWEEPVEQVRINPCWFQPLENLSDIPHAVSVQKLISFLRAGQRVRIRTKTAYYTMREVRQVGDNVLFIVAPHITGNLAMQMVISTKNEAEVVKCEAETGMPTYSRSIKVNFITWYVDAKSWRKVLTVDSDNRVTYGSVSDLISEIDAAAEVRVWVESVTNDWSRYLDINKRLITDDHKVSGVSVVSTKLELVHNKLTLTDCGLETVLVTSEGAVKVAQFLPDMSFVNSENLKGVVLTWFVSLNQNMQNYEH